MKFASCLFAMAVGFALSAPAQSEDKNVDLKLKFEKDSSYVYSANFQNWFESQSGMKSGQSTESPKSGQSTESPKSGQSTESPKSGQSQTGQSTGSSTEYGQSSSGQSGASSSMAGKALEFRIRVTDSKSDEHTLNVDIHRASGMTGGASSSSSTGESTSSTSGGATASGSEKFGTLTVKVDDKGAVKEISGWENLRLPQEFQMGESSSTSTPGSSSTQSQQQGQQSGEGSYQQGSQSSSTSNQWEKQHPFMAKFIRNQFAVLFGSGLHEKELEQGRYYYLKGTGGFEHQGSGAGATGTSTEGTQSSSTQSSGTEEQRQRQQQAGMHSKEMKQSYLNTVLYRFEGTQKQGDRELARFSVLIPQRNVPGTSGQSSSSSSSSSSSGQEQSGQQQSGQQQSGQQQSGQLSDQALAQAGWARVGEAMYSTKDGLLENCNIDFERAARGSFSAAEPSQFSKGPSLTIRRIQGPETGARSGGSTGGTSSGGSSGSSSGSTDSESNESDR